MSGAKSLAIVLICRAMVILPAVPGAKRPDGDPDRSSMVNSLAHHPGKRNWASAMPGNRGDGLPLPIVVCSFEIAALKSFEHGGSLRFGLRLTRLRSNPGEMRSLDHGMLRATRC